MATPPTFVGKNETTWTANSGNPKSVTFTPTAGNVLAAFAVSEDGPSCTIAISGGPTWALAQSYTTTGNCACYIWTATAGSGAITVTFTPGGAKLFGGNVLEFSGSDGVGASSKAQTSGAPSLGLTTLQDNSAIVVADGDWTATDGTTRTWRTVNGITPSAGAGTEPTYFRDPIIYTAYGGYYSDAGTAGAKTVGLSAPTGQTYSVIAVEVKGAAGGAIYVPRRQLVGPSAAAVRASSW